jgi:hypothetical protein
MPLFFFLSAPLRPTLIVYSCLALHHMSPGISAAEGDFPLRAIGKGARRMATLLYM